MTEDVSKLPKWAQHRIWKLEADCEYFKKKLMTCSGSPSDANVICSPYSDAPIPLPMDHIRFKTRTGHIEAHLLDDGRLVMSTSTSQMIVHPESANMVTLLNGTKLF